jgi:hypothetical protein
MARVGDRSVEVVGRSVEVRKRVAVSRAPIVLERRTTRRKKKKRDREYSNDGLLPIAVLEHRLLGGLARAASEYRHRSDSSARKRRDGALRDFVKNAARSSEEFFSQAARVPADILEEKPFNKGWGGVRRIAKIFTLRR